VHEDWIQQCTELGPRQVEPYMKLQTIIPYRLPCIAWNRMGGGGGSYSYGDQAAVVYGNNAFAVDLYGRLRMQDGNLFFSPRAYPPRLP